MHMKGSLFLRLLFSLAAMLLLAACGGPGTPTDYSTPPASSTPFVEPTATPTHRTYTDDTYTFDYPANWQVYVSDVDRISLLGDQNSTFTIYDIAEPAGSPSLEQLINDSLQEETNIFTNFQFEEITDVTIAETAWKQATWTGISQGEEIKGSTTLTTREGMVYSIRYSAPVDHFEQEYIASFKYMESSFRFTN